MRIIRIAITAFAAFTVCVLTVFIGFRIRAYLADGNNPASAGLYAGGAAPPFLAPGPGGAFADSEADMSPDYAPDTASGGDFPSTAPETAKIRADTTIIYEYCHEDGQVDTSRERAPYFLIGMTEEEMVRRFTDWRVAEFSGDRVVMQKDVPGKSGHYYIVGVKDGYIAVFYQFPVNGTNLKEITDTPVSALSARERQRLEDGIEITGEAALARIMEDYGS